jgi:hypothetical protein
MSEWKQGPESRLLDMLHGWADYVDGDEIAGHECVPSSDGLLDLYQEAGGSVMTPEQVERFVIERVIPILKGEAGK